MTPLGYDRDKFLAWLLFYQHVPYAADGQRLNPVPPVHPTDCSGYQFLALHHGCGVPFPPVVSSAQARWSYDAGLEITVGQARSIPGALLFMGPDRGLRGFGSDGHVACSLGDGRTIETPAAGHASGIRSFDGRGWSGAGLVPGMTYYGLDGQTLLPWPPVPLPATGGPPPVPVPSTPPITPDLGRLFRGLAIVEVQRLPQIGPGSGMHDSVRVWQHGLNLALDLALREDGDFGRITTDATKFLQAASGLRADAVVGPLTRDACVAVLRRHP